MINKAGKTLTIFVVLIIVLLLSSTCIGFYLYHLEERLHKNVETALDNSRADVLKLQTQLKDVQGQLALSQDKNKEADAKINSLLDEQDLNEGLRAALKKENAGLKTQIAQIDLVRQQLKTDLDNATAKLTEYQELLKTSQDQSKELENHLADLTGTNKSLQVKIDELKETLAKKEAAAAQVVVVPPASANKMELGKIIVRPQGGVQGHVLNVDADAGFVIFSLGAKQGIKPGDLLSVFRGDDYLGDIKATRVQDEMSAADIVPPLSSKTILKDDTVVPKP